MPDRWLGFHEVVRPSDPNGQWEAVVPPGREFWIGHSTTMLGAICRSSYTFVPQVGKVYNSVHLVLGGRCGIRLMEAPSVVVPEVKRADWSLCQNVL